MQIEEFFSKAWIEYLDTTPSAKKIKELLEKSGNQVFNDHIALRTFDHPKINLDFMKSFFLEQGYVECGSYDFKAKKLFAKHFEHPTLPKVFISSLRSDLFSSELQEIINYSMESVSNDQSFLDLFFKKRPWDIEYKTYQKLYEESEYAAWVYAFGIRPNHFTVDVNKLKSFTSLFDLNEFLKSQKFRLNASGGEIKGSKELYLEQSSIMADEIEVEFIDGTFKIPSCYYEFAKRYKMNDGSLFQGFVTGSADKIFESTMRSS